MNQIAVKLAAALLLRNGELSLTEIGALPFVEDETDVIEIANSLLDTYNVSLQVRGRPAALHSPVMHDLLVLNEPSNPLRERTKLA